MLKKWNVKPMPKEKKKEMRGWLLRLLGIVVGIVCLIWFLAPFLIGKILNIGNVTGIVLSVFLILYGALAPAIHKGIAAWWKKHVGKYLLLAAGLFAIICSALVVIETGCMIGACVKPSTDNATAIVLGCRVYGERASQMMVERLESAYDYLVENPQASCVVSGGQGDGEDISEAECMYRWLVAKGIDGSRIYKEDKSTSTAENIAYSQEVIEENGLFQKVVIITNDFHTYRAGVLAEKNGMVWGAAPGRTAVWLFPTYYIRELYAILAEWLF